jgi:hypothetical protein
MNTVNHNPPLSPTTGMLFASRNTPEQLHLLITLSWGICILVPISITTGKLLLSEGRAKTYACTYLGDLEHEGFFYIGQNIDSAPKISLQIEPKTQQFLYAFY